MQTKPSPPIKQVRRLFDAACNQPDADQESWLASQLDEDPQTREAALRLLKQCRRADGFLAEPVFKAESSPNREGMRIGAYRVIRELGAGGMGIVYLCERVDGVYRRLSALKVLRHTRNAQEMRERFAAEREILAALDHENIARIVDGGTTEEGLPYLLMDYVEGDPIDIYCDKYRLTLPQRLALLRETAAAVEYLHAHGVVHGDLKPANILVNREGKVKLLDFGIATLLDKAASSESLRGTWGTVSYASPEQVAGQPLGAPSDIYSLGVILFEMLAGKLPFLVKGTDPPAERIAARNVTPPSVSEAASAQRGEGVPWKEFLPGDIDAIVRKAMAPAPAQRYRSAQALNEDLRRYLASEPVLARGRAPLYVATRFLHRQWRMTAAVSAVILALGTAGWAISDMLQMRATVNHEMQLQNAMAASWQHQFTLNPGSVDSVQVSARIRWVRDNYSLRIQPMLDDPLAPRHDLRVLSISSGQFLTSLAPAALRDQATAQELIAAYMSLSELQWNSTRTSLEDPVAAYRTATEALRFANESVLSLGNLRELTAVLPQLAHRVQQTAGAVQRASQ